MTGCLFGQGPTDTQDPTRWEDAIRAYATADIAFPPPKGAIVFIGSSSIALWKTVHEDLHPLTILSRGFGGSTMRDAVYWMDTLVLKYQPRAVLIYEGDNDIGAFGGTAEEVFTDFKQFVSRIATALPKTRIYFVSIKPSVLRWNLWPEMQRANNLIKSFCECRSGVYFIDVSSNMFGGHGQPRSDIFEMDGLHPNAKGYGIWTPVIRHALLPLEARYESNSTSPTK